jgi:hypothetical protein
MIDEYCYEKCENGFNQYGKICLKDSCPKGYKMCRFSFPTETSMCVKNRVACSLHLKMKARYMSQEYHKMAENKNAPKGGLEMVNYAK